MALSAALTLTDLSDYLAPSQVCIKPVEDLNKPVEQEPGAAKTEIRVDASGNYFEHAVASTSAPRKLEKAQITLNDCLACSGCITSAESVLVNMQSHEEVYRYLQEYPDTIPVLSVAPQSLASLAVRHQLTTVQVLDGLRAFFRERLGFRVVFDTTFARHLSLIEGRHEWRERADARDRRKGKQRAMDDPVGPLPLLASACPGWICYAEKTHGELLPFASAVKSPQQIAGTLVKEWWAAKQGLRRDEIYHVSVMPCYDKKLEASRPDFQDERGTRDVDCVLTTGEVQRMLDEHAFDLRSAGKISDDPLLSSLSLLRHPGSSSGSYLHNIIDSLLSTDPSLQLETQPVRSDYVDYLLRSSHDGSVVFKGAQCYGFRNLQNVVRKVGREAGVAVARGALGKAPASNGRRVVRRNQNGVKADVRPDDERSYDYIEVMACPSGCVNGGGQLAPSLDAEGMSISAKDWLVQVEEAYWSTSPGDEMRDTRDRMVAEVLHELPTGALRTQYRAVEPMEVNALAVKW